MISAGIDIGSRTIKVVLNEDGRIINVRKAENSIHTLDVCEKLLDGLTYDKITATGYGRNLYAEYFEADVISEIKAFSLGTHYLFPTCRTILDIGGQDTKVISLGKDGRFKKFEMNDKCAAGTGRFLEIMAMTLRFNLEEFGEKALTEINSVNINSMCTVFAESEVISLMAKGLSREQIAKGIHQAIVNRSISLLNKINIEDDLLFAGGVAYNICVRTMIEKQLNKKLLVADDPQIVGAIGAALCI